MGVMHRGRGYGYARGYTGIEGFLPLIQNDFDSLTAFDGRFMISNSGDLGGNIGVFHRRYFEDWNRTLGGSIYFDDRHFSNFNYQQVGIGFESLGEVIDTRANIYLPVGRTQHITSQTITNSRFVGRNVQLDLLCNQNTAMGGVDSEIGGRVPMTGEFLYAYAGAYHFQATHKNAGIRQAWGPQGRLEARFSDLGTVYCSVSNDQVFHTNFYVGVSIWLPGTGPSRAPSRVQFRLSEPIIRNHNIAIGDATLFKQQLALNPNGSLMDVAHVDSAAAGTHDGSITNPYSTLAQAQAGTAANSIIYLHANSVFNNQSLTLQTGQQLLGEGATHPIQAQQGLFNLPPVSPPSALLQTPLISNSAGDAVTVASNTTVSGIRIQNATGNAITGDAVNNVTIDHNDLANNNNGIVLTNASGNILINHNFLTSNTVDGIDVSTATTGTSYTNLTLNSFNNMGQRAVNYQTHGSSVNSLVLFQNNFDLTLGPLVTNHTTIIQIDSKDGSLLNARVEQNNILDVFNRDATTVSTDDPYYHLVTVNSQNTSQMDIAFMHNTFNSNRKALNNSPANGSFGIDSTSTDQAILRQRYDTNTSNLNFALSRSSANSVFALENTLTTNTGTFYYFPSSNFFTTISPGTLQPPQ